MKKIIRILPIIIGSMMLLYPWIGNWLYDYAVRSQAAGYEKALIEKPETELQNCILAAQNYNEELKKRQNVMIYPPQEQSLNHEAYDTGQASAHIPHLTVLHRPVFLLNSCLSLFSAANSRWHPFSRSYGVILPSSLTMLLPPALGFSPHPPVSVYGTGILKTIAAFLDSWLTHFPTLVRSASRLWIATRFFLCDSSFACTRLSIPRLCSPQMSPQFCFKIVQESQPAVHRIRISASP